MLTMADQSGIYGKYAPLIHSRCRRMARGPDEGDELAWAVFRELLERWPTFRKGGSASAWIHGRTARLLLVILKRELAWGLDGGTAWEDDERFTGVGAEGRRLLARLAAKPEMPWETMDREIAVLTHWDRLGPEEISTLTGISEGEVRARLERLRKRFQPTRSPVTRLCTVLA